MTAKMSPRLFQLNRHRTKHLVLASHEVHTAKSTSISRKQKESNSPQKLDIFVFDPHHNLALLRSLEGNTASVFAFTNLRGKVKLLFLY